MRRKLTELLKNLQVYLELLVHVHKSMATTCLHILHQTLIAHFAYDVGLNLLTKQRVSDIFCFSKLDKESPNHHILYKIRIHEYMIVDFLTF